MLLKMKSILLYSFLLLFAKCVCFVLIILKSSYLSELAVP